VQARQEPDWSIFVQLRVSRTLLGLFAGGALSLAGALFRRCFVTRWRHRTRWDFGRRVSRCCLAIWMDWQQVAGLPAIWFASLAGASAVLAVVVGAALQQRRVSSFSLLLSGLAANSVCSALIIVIYGLVGANKSFSISRWLIGSLDALDYRTLLMFIAAIAIAAAVVLRQAKAWNLMAVDPPGRRRGARRCHDSR
jgi:iron complex transport system permease protein